MALVILGIDISASPASGAGSESAPSRKKMAPAQAPKIWEPFHLIYTRLHGKRLTDPFGIPLIK
jgi:hypothetical protein